MKTYRGFTLIELIAVVLITAVIMTVVGLSLKASTRNYMTTGPLMTMSSQAAFTIENASREIQAAQSITSGSATSITFVNQAGNTVTIAQSGTTLTRSESGVNGGSAFAMCNNVSTVAFAYYDSSLSVTATPGNVRYITMQLTLQSAINAQTVSYTLLTGVVLRSLV